jgi:hypothetical protein
MTDQGVTGDFPTALPSPLPAETAEMTAARAAGNVH